MNNKRSGQKDRMGEVNIISKKYLKYTAWNVSGENIYLIFSNIFFIDAPITIHGSDSCE